MTTSPITIPVKRGSTIFITNILSLINIYLNPTLACQTNANKKNKTGITGMMSARGPKTAKTPGNLLNNNVSIFPYQMYFLFVYYLNINIFYFITIIIQSTS